MFKHFVMTRFGLGIFSEEWYKHRFEIFEAITMPSILNQTEKNFKWIIFVDINLPEYARIKFFEYTKKDSRIIIYYINQIKENIDSDNLFNLMIDSDNYILTSRIDDDDAIALDTFEKVYNAIKKENLNNLDSDNSKSLLLTLPLGYEFDINIGRYTEYRHLSLGMAIYLLLPPHIKKSCYSYSHSNIIEKSGAKHIELNKTEHSWLYTRHLQADSRLNKVKEGYKRFDENDYKYFSDTFGVDPEKLNKYITNSKSVKKLNKEVLVNSSLVSLDKFKKRQPTPMMIRNILISILKKHYFGEKILDQEDLENYENEYYRLGTELF